MKLAGVATAPGPNRFVRTIAVTSPAHDAAPAVGRGDCASAIRSGPSAAVTSAVTARARAGEGGAGDPDDAVDLGRLAVRAPDQRARVGILAVDEHLDRLADERVTRRLGDRVLHLAALAQPLGRELGGI